jgi:hypothetical protein
VGNTHNNSDLAVGGDQWRSCQGEEKSLSVHLEVGGIKLRIDRELEKR